MTLRIIALHGQAGAGKDTFADRLVDRHGFVKRGFADPLYEEVAAAYGVTVEWLRDRGRKELPQPELALLVSKSDAFVESCVERHGFNFSDIGAPRSPRWTLEQWGTEYRRAQTNTYWLDRMSDFVASQPRDVAGVVIPDCRFLNEAQWVCRNLGSIYRVERPGLKPVSSHVSALPLPDYVIERTIYNTGTISLLHAIADFASRAYARTA